MDIFSKTKFTTFTTLIFFITFISLLVLTISPASALYEFEGIPLDTRAVGEIEGDLIISGTYGISAPPVIHTITLPAAPDFACVYTGVWGGTEKYTGWVEIAINGGNPKKFNLLGEGDCNPDVYASSHGSYWVSHDVTTLLTKGDNEITVTTSRGEKGNRLDGRVYAITVIAAVPGNHGHLVQYWIAAGNENLHGEGWAGTNPTKKDSSSCTFENANLKGLESAWLGVVLTATNSGQPDYILFNGKDPSVPGTAEIGNEISFDAGGSTGTGTETRTPIRSRYVDAEIFDVTSLSGNKNTIVFERGRDLNGDGKIATSGQETEGEDYIHPCIAVLALEKNGVPLKPDYAIEKLTAENAYTDRTATLTARIYAYGSHITTKPPSVIFTDNGEEIGRKEFVTDPDGISDVSIQWNPKPGTHTVTATVSVPKDRDSINDRKEISVTVGTLPDLKVSSNAPYRASDTQTQNPSAPAKSPMFPLIAGFGIAGAFIFTRRREDRKNLFLITAILFTLFLITLVVIQPAGASGEYVEYILPLSVTNTGGSDAPPFFVTVWLDGEKTAVKQVESGLSAGSTIDLNIPLFTTPGTHTVKVVADGNRDLTEQSKENNVHEVVYDFP
ncbi:MAG: DUF3344 domain-containing protein [Euryarchaeota archaeon]|nr:DUF3344 domain-containing protein [Euryarchaeota archaeon]